MKYVLLKSLANGGGHSFSVLYGMIGLKSIRRRNGCKVPIFVVLRLCDKVSMANKHEWQSSRTH